MLVFRMLCRITQCLDIGCVSIPVYCTPLLARRPNVASASDKHQLMTSVKRHHTAMTLESPVLAESTRLPEFPEINVIP